MPLNKKVLKKKEVHCGWEWNTFVFSNADLKIDFRCEEKGEFMFGNV